MYPGRDTLSNVPCSGYIFTACDQSMVESGMTKGGKNTARSCQFFFFSVNEHNNTNTKPQAKKQRFLKLSQKFPEEKQQLVEEKDADNIRKVLCKSFIQWFWELNLCCYKYRVDCFGSLRLFFCCCSERSKSGNITKHLVSGPSRNQLLLFSLKSWWTLRKTKLTLSVEFWHQVYVLQHTASSHPRLETEPKF